MWIDPELWPSGKELVGLRFATPEDFEKCWWMAMEHPEAFRWTWWDDLTAEVRKTHKYLVDEAGLTYTEYKIVDLDELPTEERLRQEREGVQQGMKILLERLRRENGSV